MSAKVTEVLRQMEAKQFDEALNYKTIEELLEAYPEFVFDEKVRGTTDVWHDLEKKVTPIYHKNSLNYNINDLMPYIEKELVFLLKVRNLIRKILCVATAYRNKALFLQIIEHVMGVELNTGGGISPAVRRVVLIYEKEGNVCAKKRKTTSKDEKEPFEKPERPEKPAKDGGPPIVKRKIERHDEVMPLWKKNYLAHASQQGIAALAQDPEALQLFEMINNLRNCEATWETPVVSEPFVSAPVTEEVQTEKVEPVSSFLEDPKYDYLEREAMDKNIVLPPAKKTNVNNTNNNVVKPTSTFFPETSSFPTTNASRFGLTQQKSNTGILGELSAMLFGQPTVKSEQDPNKSNILV